MARIGLAGIALAVLARASLAIAADPAGIVEIGCSDTGQRVELPANGVLVVVSKADQPVWLELTERGHLVSSIAPTPGDAISVTVPYRYGRHLARLEPAQRWRIERVPPLTRAAASVGIRAQCDDTPEQARHRQWLAGLSAITAQLNRMLAKDEADPLLKEVSALQASATDATEQALARHARAQTLVLAWRSAESVEAFADAEQAWIAAGDADRAQVARVGRVEDLQRLSRHAEALALAGDVSREQARIGYFPARLRLTRCLTMRYLGRTADALACFRDGVADMEFLDEIPDMVSGLQDMADVSRIMGDRAGARQLGRRALAKCTLPGMEITRGRIQLMLADIAVEQGDITEALIDFDDALTEFAAGGVPRWEANALLQTAKFYQGLGALEEASDFVAAALSRLSERDAPARVAAARAAQASIDLKRGLIDRAQRGLASVIETYGKLSMPAELDSARATNARLLLQIGDRAAAADLIASRDTGQAYNRDLWRMIEAGLLATQGQCAKALAILVGFDGKPISIEHELEQVQIRAECLSTNGSQAEAERNLAASARGIAALAQRIDNPLLRQVLAGYVATLRRCHFRLHANANDGNPGDPATIWQWLHLDDAIMAVSQSTAATTKQATRFDAEVARELLPQSPATDARVAGEAPRHLLAVLASQRKPDAGPVAVVKETSLADLQQRLGDAVLVTYVDAGSHSQLMLISRDRVRLQPTADAATLRSAADRLTVSASERTTPLPRIDADAARLASLLWPSPADMGAPPGRLLVDASSPLASLPWSLLNWPGTQAMLVETTRVTIARIGTTTARPVSSPGSVAVFVAGQEDDPTLAPLWNAQSEPALVEAGLRERGGTVSRIAATDREALIAAFSQPRPWLHVAAHGSSLPTKIGYAGIWLDAAEAGQSPRFVSWMEILARGAVNELVVLNACQLAEAQQTAIAGLNFADAVSRAGARDVVAARWQVSDGATTLWVPTFYRAMGEGAGAATALWQAQRRLHDSRMFRHPFYWASYVHYEWI